MPSVNLPIFDKNALGGLRKLGDIDEHEGIVSDESQRRELAKKLQKLWRPIAKPFSPVNLLDAVSNV